MTIAKIGQARCTIGVGGFLLGCHSALGRLLPIKCTLLYSSAYRCAASSPTSSKRRGLGSPNNPQHSRLCHGTIYLGAKRTSTYGPVPLLLTLLFSVLVWRHLRRQRELAVYRFRSTWDALDLFAEGQSVTQDNQGPRSPASATCG